MGVALLGYEIMSFIRSFQNSEANKIAIMIFPTSYYLLRPVHTRSGFNFYNLRGGHCVDEEAEVKRQAQGATACKW